MAVVHRGQLLGRARWLQMLGQCVDDFSQRPSLEPVLLGSAPSIWRLARQARGSRREIFADMKIVAQEGAFLPKDFCGLQADPFSSVAQRMNLAVESPTGATRTVAPTPAHFSPLHQKWRRKMFQSCPGLVPHSAVFPSNPAAFCPFAARVPLCRSCSRQPRQPRTALPVPAKRGRIARTPSQGFPPPFARAPRSPPSPRWH